MIRLDKYLVETGVGSRSEVKNFIKKGLVKVNQQIVKSNDLKIDQIKDQVSYKDQPLDYKKFEYYMLNKPAGVISATQDNFQKTVIDIVKSHRDVFPVGRLDKDTEGLLIITDDGELAHRLLSPKKHVKKTYYAKVEGHVTDADIEAFQKGLVIDEEFTAMPATLKIIKSGEISEVEVTIVEGKFHQVKRMFKAIDKHVIYLKRIAMGSLILDETLDLGAYRELTADELRKLQE